MGIALLLLSIWMGMPAPEAAPPAPLRRSGDAFTLKMSYAATPARRGAATIAWTLQAESRVTFIRRLDGLAATIEATRPWAGKGLKEAQPATLTLAEERRLLLHANGQVAHVDRDLYQPLPSCWMPSREPTPPGPVAEHWSLLVMLHAAARDGTDTAEWYQRSDGPINPMLHLELRHGAGACPDGKPGSCRRALLTNAFHAWGKADPPEEVTTAELLLDRDLRPWRFSRRTVQRDSGRVITFVIDFRGPARSRR